MTMRFGQTAGYLAVGVALSLTVANAAPKKPKVKPVPAQPDGKEQTVPEQKTGDIVIADFEQGNGNWIAIGPAFGGDPAMGAEVLKKLKIENAAGLGVASSEGEGDEPQGTLTSPEFRIERRYLTFLIGGGDFEHSTCLDLLVNGKVVKSASGSNSDKLAPVTWDLQAWSGQKAKIRLVDAASGQWGHVNVDQIVQTNTPGKLLVTAPLYEEKLRPQFHFTARQWTVDRLNPGQQQEGWCNDLNGLIYYDGEYHLFAQRWGKCWVHAVSKDLVHWKELEPAFWEEKLGSGVQSGTCVIDYKNTSGLGSAANPAMIAFWTRFDQRTHCISYSLDHGRTWKHYDKNPVLAYPERDPKVFWHEPTKRWVMVMYGNQAYHVFTSANLLEWKDEKSEIPNSFECPDMFELPVDGRKDERKWVLVRGDGKYSLGAFDGAKFSEETPQMTCDVGPNFYATQSWANTDTGDGRRVQVAWMRGGKYPDMPFNQQISFPCELTLHTTPKGVRLFREPVKEIASLHGESFAGKDLTLHVGEVNDLIPPVSGKAEMSGRDLLHIQAQVKIPDGSKLVLNLRGTQIALTSKALLAGGTKTEVMGEIEKVEILLDRTSVEVFLNGGEVSYTACLLPQSDDLTTKAEGADVLFPEMKVYELKSAWVTK
jgi:sucrose-6-phosphate hydrolase SacC (GH32 family)